MSELSTTVQQSPAGTLAKLFAAVCLLTAIIFCWQTVASAVVGFGLELVAPLESTVSGTVGLEAHTTSDAAEVFFDVRAQDGSFNDSIPATRGATSAQVWVGSWETGELRNGYYEIAARGRSVTGAEQRSETALVQLENTSSAVGRGDSLSTTVIEPSGGETVSGMVEFSASTNADPSSVMFVLTGPAVTGAIPIEASSAGPDIWTASWDSRSVPAGTYQVQAQSVVPIGVNESTWVSFTIAHPEPEIEVIRPVADSVQSGAVTLAARTSAPVGSMKFLVQDAAGRVVAENLPAHQIGSNDWTEWEVVWDSSRASAGTYAVRADTPEGRSDLVTFVLEVESADDLPPDEPLSDESGDEESFVTITSPAYDDTLTGSVGLRAVASTGADQVKFKLLSASSSTPVLVLDATYSAAVDGWIANWNTEDTPNGIYQLQPAALFGTRNVDGEMVQVTINNEAPIILATHISAPRSGATLTGWTELVASTTREAEALLFRITPLTSGVAVASWELAAEPSLGHRSWSVDWNTNEQASGEYQVVALAVDAGVTVASAPIVVEIAGSTDMNVALVSPTSGSEWSSLIILAAVSEPRAESMRFTLTQSDVAGGEYHVEADYDSTIRGWVGEMDAATLLPGAYRIQAEASDERGTKYYSPSVEVMIEGEDDEATEDGLEEIGSEDMLDRTATVLHPAAGEVVSGLYELVAELEGSATALHFVVAPAEDSTRTSAQIIAQEASTGLWTAEWDSHDLPNGPYQVRARVEVSAGLIIYSDWIPLTVENESTDDREPAELLIVSPTDNTQVRGSVSITVEATVDTDAVMVVVESADETDYEVRLDAEPVGEHTWAAVWAASDVAPGKYVLAAVANVEDVGAVSESVIVNLSAGEDDGFLTEEDVDEEAGDEPDDTTEQADEGKEEPANAETPYQLSAELKLVAPEAGPVRGTVLLLAKADGSVREVEFVLRDNADGRILMVRRAAQDTVLNRWVSYWQADNFKPGSYELLVRGKNSARQPIKSEPIIVQILPHAEVPGSKPDVLKTIVKLPSDAVREAIQELPAGTKIAYTPDEPLNNQEAENALQAECATSGVSPERCELWLAERYGSKECRQVGILTKSECLAYLAELQGGHILECASYDEQKCREYAARATQGLIDEPSLKDFNRELLPFVGRAVVLPPEDESAGELSETVVKKLSIKGDGKLRVRMYASPAYVQVDQQTSRRAVPAVLLVDTDDDGLPDDAERRLGTDPNDADTDGDGYEDGDEISNGYNPLGFGLLEDSESASGRILVLAPIDVTLLSGVPLEQPWYSGQTNDDFSIDIRGFDPDAGTTADDESSTEEGLVFEGQAEPGAVVTIFIYSYLPLVLTAEADEHGDWSYEMNHNLVDGRHEAYVTVTDDTGRIGEKSSPLSFFISEAKAVSEDSFFGNTILEADDSPYLAPEEVNRRDFNWYIFGAIAMAVVVLLIGMVIVIRPRRNRDYRDL